MHCRLTMGSFGRGEQLSVSLEAAGGHQPEYPPNPVLFS